MLTNKDRTEHVDGALTHHRVAALIHALRAEAADADHASRRDGIDERLAAALRGKKLAYSQAALMVEQVARGHGLRPRSYSTARRTADAFRARRNARRSPGGTP